MKKYFTYILLVLVIVLVGTNVYVYKKFSTKEVPIEQNDLKKGEIKNLKEYNGDLHSFSVMFNYNNGYLINKDYLRNNNIKVYEFDAGIANSWEVKTNHYVGFRLTDLIKSFNIEDTISRVKFYGTGYREVTYLNDEINDDIFIVFYRDGKKINDSTINLLSVRNVYDYSVEHLAEIMIYTN